MIAIVVAVILVGIFIPYKGTYVAEHPPEITVEEEEIIEEEVNEMPTIDEWITIQSKNHGADESIMRAIIKCESNMYQLDPGSGEPLVNRNYRVNKDTGERYLHSSDWGLFQINDRAWDARAKELNYDYKNNAYDNVMMGFVILEEQGLNAWVCYTKNMV